MTWARLGDVSSSVAYGYTASATETDTGVRFLRTTDLGGGGLNWFTVPFCDISERDLAKHRLQAGDIVISRMGTVGLSALVDPPQDAVAASYLVRFRLLHDVADPLFVSYVLRSTLWWSYVDSRRTGSVQPNLNAQLMSDFRFAVPPLAEQRAIAGVLGALDDKIESNRRIVATVDGLVRAEFAAAATDPDGEEVTFASLAERINKPADPRDLDAKMPYIGLEHMPRGTMILDDWGVAAGLESGKSFFERGDVLFGKLRPYFRKVGVSPVGGVCSTDVLVLRPRRGLGLLAAVAASDELIGYASAAASGTKMPRVSWDYIADFKVIVPGPERSAALELTLTPALERALRAVEECRSLTALRDALLPELLSGRLRVREAEEMVGSV